MRQSGYPIWLLTLTLAAATFAAIVYATGMGHIAVPGGDILRVIAARVTGNPSLLAGIDPVIPFVVFDVRLPRILTATLVGGGLAMSGVIYQGILLNPLADPYTLGVSSGAAFGAALTLLVVLYLSSFNGQISANTLILSGVIVGAILAAGISFLKYLADEQVAVIIFWLMGSFASRTWLDVGVVTAALVCGLLLSLFYARDLNILSLGNRSADTLGVESTRVRWILLLGASLVTAVCVSVSGIIGFIGLIIPHLMRFLVGPDNRKLLPVSILAGALLLLAADTVTRAVLPVEVPIGVLTALIGGPFFCVIFRRRQRRAL